MVRFRSGARESDGNRKTGIAVGSGQAANRRAALMTGKGASRTWEKMRRVWRTRILTDMTAVMPISPRPKGLAMEVVSGDAFG